MEKLSKLTKSEDRLVGAETLVETKRISRSVEVGQMHTTVYLGGVSMGVRQLLSVAEDNDARASQRGI